MTNVTQLQDTPEDVLLKEEYDELFDYGQSKTILQSLVNDWRDYTIRAEFRRKLRLVELDLEAMRKSGQLMNDETFIPMRVIDENIKREQPSYMNFLTKATKLISFTDVREPTLETDILADQFSKGMKYHGWELSWHSEIDGTQLHGVDAVEVVFDKSKPLNVAIEHIGNDKLFYPFDCTDIQTAPRVIRKYMLTRIQLRNFVRDFGFDAKEVNKVIDNNKTDKRFQTFEIYKVLWKWDKTVYVAWFSLKYAENWLKAPAKLYNGVRKQSIVTELDQLGQPVQKEVWEEVYEEIYPIFQNRYMNNENPRLTDCKGRAFFDANKQEAQTTIATGFVNALSRATNLYACPKLPSGSGASPKQTDVRLEHGTIISEPMEFFNLPYPEAQAILGALSYFDQRNLSEAGQTTEALRRKKGEKTATEYDSAKEDASFLNSTPMTLFSMHVREVYTYVWRIARSQAMQGLVPLLNLDITDGPDGTTLYTNDNEKLARTYDLRAAGDVEVIQKAQKIDRMLQIWGIIAPSPLATPFLIELLKELFPENGAKYEAILKTGDAGRQLLVSFMTLLNGMIKKYPQEVATMSPQEQQQLAELEAQAKQYLGLQDAGVDSSGKVKEQV